MSLTDPTRKMSKSDSEDSYIAVLDSKDVIRKKMRRAVTDSDGEIRIDPENKPGVTNLINILCAMTGQSAEEACNALQGKGYGALKDTVADAVIEVFTPIQERYAQLITAYLSQVRYHHAQDMRGTLRSMKNCLKGLIGGAYAAMPSQCR